MKSEKGNDEGNGTTGASRWLCLAVPFSLFTLDFATEEEAGRSANYALAMVVSHGPDFAEMVAETRSVDDTQAIARRLGQELDAGDFVALVGPLGAGKTAFVQGLAEGLKTEGAVTSPTFVLMRLHRGPVPLAHADAYRLEGAGDLADLGLADWLDDCVVALEWADTVVDALPGDRIEVRIDYTEDGRSLRILGLGPRSAEVIERVQA